MYSPGALRTLRPHLTLLGSVVLVVSCTPGPGANPDLVIRGGLVVDGTGAPGVEQDVAVAEGRIVAMGPELARSGRREIDARGLVVSPGFIDVHSHADRGLPSQPDNHNNIRQGITSVVTGNCGKSPVDLGDFFQDLERQGVTTNVAGLIGHNSVREDVMGMRDGEATLEELAAMEALVQRAMADGALGLSTGLLYPPGTFSTSEEVIALARVASRAGGLYASHIRSEEQAVWEAVEEAVRVGEEAQLSVQISHIKLAAEVHWGKADRYRGLLSAARERGVRVRADQYPYPAGSATLENILPRWSLDGGREAFLERAADPPTRRRIRQGILEGRLASTRGRNRGEIVFVARCPAHPECEGQNLVELCRRQGLDPTVENAAEMAIRLLEDGPVQAVNFLMNEDDVRAFLSDPDIMVSTDGGVARYGEGVPHPRNYGTYPRLLGHYVRDEKVLTLEEAVRKSTGLPAKQMGLEKRGTLAPGQWADIVVFDPESIIDTATFEEPHQYPVGIAYVIVNGAITVEDGTLTAARPGQILRGPGAAD